MNTVERLRPEPQVLDPEWSKATLQHIFASNAPAPEPRRRTRRRVLAVGAVAASTLAAVILGATTMGTAPAFAVTEASNGDVVVTIHRLTDEAGLEKALLAQGIKAKVTYLTVQVPSEIGDSAGSAPCSLPVESQPFIAPEEGDFQITFPLAYLDTHRGSELSLTAAGGTSADDWAGAKLEWSDGRC